MQVTWAPLAGLTVVRLSACVSRPAKWLPSCWQLFAACTTIVQGLMTHGKHFRRITRVDRVPLVVAHMRRVAARDAVRTTKVNERYGMKSKLPGQWRLTVLAVKSEEQKMKRLAKLRHFINCLHKTTSYAALIVWKDCLVKYQRQGRCDKFSSMPKDCLAVVLHRTGGWSPCKKKKKKKVRFRWWNRWCTKESAVATEHCDKTVLPSRGSSSSLKVQNFRWDVFGSYEANRRGRKEVDRCLHVRTNFDYFYYPVQSDFFAMSFRRIHVLNRPLSIPLSAYTAIW